MALNDERERYRNPSIDRSLDRMASMEFVGTMRLRQPQQLNISEMQRHSFALNNDRERYKDPSMDRSLDPTSG